MWKAKPPWLRWKALPDMRDKRLNDCEDDTDEE